MPYKDPNKQRKNRRDAARKAYADPVQRERIKARQRGYKQRNREDAMLEDHSEHQALMMAQAREDAGMKAWSHTDYTMWTSRPARPITVDEIMKARRMP